MLYYLTDGPNYVIVASNAGVADEPSWWLNLQDQPDADIDLPDGPHPVRAREADDVEHSRLWPRLVAGEPRYETYAQTAGRTIPVVILEPQAAPGAPEIRAGSDA